MEYNGSAGFSRLFVIWGITLIVVVLSLIATLYLIDQSKQTIIPTAPPPLPVAANPSDIPPPPQEVNLFLIDPTALMLVPVKIERRLHTTELTMRLGQVVKALIQETPPNFRNPIPRGTLLNEVYVDSNQTAYLDFSNHLADGHIGGTTAEGLTVMAILKTVFDAFPDDIKQVQILIDGNQVKTLAGHLNLSQPLHFFN